MSVAGLVGAPTRAGAQMTFSLSGPAAVDARVLNLAGRPVKTLCCAMDCHAGANTLLWNAQSATGLPVPSGVYLVEVIARGAAGSQARAIATVRVGR